MLSLVDTFIEYLATELEDAPPVHWVRVSDDENSNRPQMNYLNITVLGFTMRGQIEEALVSLDLIGSDERTVLALAKTVRDKLLERQYTPEWIFDLDPSSPTATGKCVEWEQDKVNFSVIVTDTHYVHLNATFPICHARQ
jgi:hypothetical protein